MARNDKSDQSLQQAIAMGQQNKALLPRLRNWCRHLKIVDQSGGLVHEMYGLPMNLALSCPHAEGEFMAMNLEWNAHMFITDNCINCAFHDEIFPQNFGRDVLAQRAQAEQAAAQEAQELAAQRAVLQAEIDTLLAHEQTQADTKSLSILTLVQQLGNTEIDQVVTAATVLEAARLSPSFFTAAALNYMALQLESAQASVLLQALRTLIESGNILPDFALQRLVSLIKGGEQLDAIVGVLQAAITPTELLAHPELIRRIVERLRYDHRAARMRDEEAKQMVYPNVVALLQKIAIAEPAAFQHLLSQQLALPDKEERIRVLGLLQDLALVAPELVLPFTDAVVRSFAFVEDGYGESADHAARHLLASLYEHRANIVATTLQELYPQVSVDVQLELLEFYGRALRDDNLVRPQHAALWTNQLVTLMATTTGDDTLKHAALKQVEDIARRAPHLLLSYQDTLLGCLVSSTSEYRTFQWFRSELQNPSTPPTTFNPLLGRNVFELESLDIQARRRLRQAEGIVEHLLEINHGDMHHAVVAVFNELSSETDGFLKEHLLKLLRVGLKDPIRIGQTLPVIYTSLFDTAALNVRREALRSVEHLLERYPQCVTITLLGAVKALLNDPDVLIQGLAIRAYGALVGQFTEQVEPEHLQHILEAITNRYVALHQAAAATALSIAPLLTPEQRLLLLFGLLQLEATYYKDKDYEYCKDLIGNILRLTQDDRAQRLRIVEICLVKYCTCGDVFIEKEFLTRLTHLAADEPQLRPIWLAQALAYMERVEPDYSSLVDLRDVLLPALQQLPYEEIVAHQAALVAFTQAQIRSAHYQDVYSMYALFGVQGLHTPLQELTLDFIQQVPATKSNKYALEVNASFHRLSGLEVAVAAVRVDEPFLATLRTP